MESLEVFEHAARLLRRRAAFVLVTVIETKGSTPRDVGARMLFVPGKGFVGTVGGGQFEELVKDGVERAIRERATLRERFTLGTEAEQCCGGVMEVLIEYLGPRQRVVLFGGGHVSHELVRLLRSSALEIVVVDDRDSWNTSDRFPDVRRVHSYEEGVRIVRERPASTLACVLTCSHETDFAIIRDLARDPPAYLGLIGSRSKRACFFRRLAASGLSEAQIEHIRCPMGLGNMGKAPAQVAISIAGELLLRAREMDSL